MDLPCRDLLAVRTATTPERTALVDADHRREWTYRALDTLVDDVAARLQTMHDDTGSREGRPRVACVLSTRVAFVVTYHAVVRAGGVLVPLNTELTVPEFEAVADRTDPDLLVCESRSERTARQTVDCPVVSVDQPQADGVTSLLPAGGADAPAPVARDPTETALVLFTSGTTGRPKGVRLTPQNLTASAVASAFRLGVTPDDRWLCCLPPYHMGGLAPAVRTTLYGTTLVVQSAFDATETATVLDRERITGVSLVPTQLRRLLDEDWTPPESLRTVLLGGAPASEQLVTDALDAGVPVHTTYGLTETSSQVATARPSTLRDHPTTVGQPLLWTTVTVIDEDGRPCETGETGELVVDGPTVTPGYLDEGHTAKAFGEFGLHTGDVGYRDDDGRLWIRGRQDDVVITGGELVVPGEVATCIETCAAVAEATVVGVDDEEWGQRVVALVVPAENGPDATADAVRRHCEDRLAPFKQPKDVVVAAEIPRTASGTVDRERVRELVGDSLDSS